MGGGKIEGGAVWKVGNGGARESDEDGIKGVAILKKNCRKLLEYSVLICQ